LGPIARIDIEDGERVSTFERLKEVAHDHFKALYTEGTLPYPIACCNYMLSSIPSLIKEEDNQRRPDQFWRRT